MGSTTKARSREWPRRVGPTPLAAMLGYLLAFTALTWPLAGAPLDAVVSHWDADIEHSLWVQWWFAQALASPDHELFRSAMIAHPQAVDLQLADLNLAVNALSYPATPLLGLAGAYNALLLGAFLVSGLLTFRLAKRLGSEPPAAWVAGLVFAASPYWLACLLNGWGYLVHTGVFPLVALALFRVREDPGGRWLFALALALAFAFHVTPYYFLYLLVLLPILVLADAGAWREVLRASRPVVWIFASATLVLAVAPRAVSMLEASRASLVVHHGPQNTVLSAAISELVRPSFEAVAARAPEIGFLAVFLGYTLLATVLAGFLVTRRRVAYRPWLFGAGAMLLLALGPHPKWSSGLSFDAIPLPALWLQQLPAFEMTTNHWRWVLPASFCLCVLLARATTDLMALAREFRRERWVPALVLAAYAAEVVLVFPIPLHKPLWDARPSPIAALLRDRTDIRAVLDRSGRPKLNQTVHGKAIALGWLPRMPVETRRAQARLVAECRGLEVPCLRRFDIDAVILDDTRAVVLRGSPAAPELERLEVRSD